MVCTQAGVQDTTGVQDPFAVEKRTFVTISCFAVNMQRTLTDLFGSMFHKNVFAAVWIISCLKLLTR